MIRLVRTLAIASCLTAAIAQASPPSPGNSYVDPCIVTCPAGDSVFTVITRGFSGFPIPWGTTTVRLCDCPDLRIAESSAANGYTLLNDCNASKPNDTGGVADFGFVSGDLCSGASIVVDCDGVILATRNAVASFDQNGDLDVDGFDILAVRAKQGTSDPTADFDCDGQVTSLDVQIATAHVGHVPTGPLAVGSRPTLRLSATPLPNPGQGPTEFVLRVPVAGHASLSVHDLGGRRLATVLERDLDSGVHRAAWSGRDETGRPALPGLYFYRFSVGRETVRGTIVVRR